ncbi:MAG: hypothetical protein AAF503_14000 [Pseudomonadota bacterium]
MSETRSASSGDMTRCRTCLTSGSSHTYYWLEPEVRQVLHRVISPELAERVSLMPERPSDEVEA